MIEMIGPEHLTLREQLKLLEMANGASDYQVRQHALSILNEYRNPPVFYDTHAPKQMREDRNG